MSREDGKLPVKSLQQITEGAALLEKMEEMNKKKNSQKRIDKNAKSSVTRPITKKATSMLKPKLSSMKSSRIGVLTADQKSLIGRSIRNRWQEQMRTTSFVAAILAGAGYQSFQTQGIVRKPGTIEEAFVILVTCSTLTAILAVVTSLTIHDHLGRSADIHVLVILKHYKRLCGIPRYILMLGTTLYIISLCLQGSLHYDYFWTICAPVALGVSLPVALLIFLQIHMGWRAYIVEANKFLLIHNNILESISEIDWAHMRKELLAKKKYIFRHIMEHQALAALLIVFAYSAFTKQIEVIGDQIGIQVSGYDKYEKADPTLKKTFTTLIVTALMLLVVSLFTGFYLTAKVASCTEDLIPIFETNLIVPLRAPHFLNFISLLILLIGIFFQAVIDMEVEAEVLVPVIFGIYAIGALILFAIIRRVDTRFLEEMQDLTSHEVSNIS
eukprot:CAMPEP_0184484010 /NCGR_PEP_ID=MMETSP0113_2-20130426/5705_1 /TAXON_ID=91329 /ORGANISM="Norrisiella sphaerica, Strain BC52" /LENGTH=441 /DNA_ID=CAMNT_0026864751 /DNA_START=14 /DNA_END=1339 /DNA_ORIENTATION=-